MKLRVLGCSGAEFPGHNPSAFLIDDALLLDAGTIGSVLEEEEQWNIREILITHPHLDHIRGIPLLADNIVMKGRAGEVRLFATAEVLAPIRDHLLNGVIWPDFTRIPSEESPILRCTEIVPEQEFRIGRYRITAFPVNHPVPAVGYRISSGGATLVYTGDTGPTDRIWSAPGTISALVAEVSFPNEMAEVALMTGHLTPCLLRQELLKCRTLPGRILVTHLKPQYHDQIRDELGMLAIPGIELLSDGRCYEF
jgi:ribonuclease BN (tRNA processing enzyme)